LRLLVVRRERWAVLVRGRRCWFADGRTGRCGMPLVLFCRAFNVFHAAAFATACSFS